MKHWKSNSSNRQSEQQRQQSGKGKMRNKTLRSWPPCVCHTVITVILQDNCVLPIVSAADWPCRHSKYLVPNFVKCKRLRLSTAMENTCFASPAYNHNDCR